jgi:neural Wiskott-Aldrich syndrome protein
MTGDVRQTVCGIVGGNVDSLAKVRVYEGEHGVWVYTELEGFAALVTHNGYSVIKVVDLNTNSCEFEQELYPGMTYHSNSSFFHFFEGDDVIIGLSFGNDNEASAFASAVNSKIPTNTQSTSSAPNEGIVKRELAPLSRATGGSSTSNLNTTSSPQTPKSATPASVTSSSNVQRGAPQKKKFGGFGGFRAKIAQAFGGDNKEHEEFVLSGPTGFRHQSHIGWDPENGFDVKNIPPEWRKLFQAAGVKKSELQDANTAKFIMQTVSEAMAAEGGGAPPPPPPPGPPPPGPPPSMGAPAARQAGAAGGGDLLLQIQQGKELKKVDPNEPPDIKELDQGTQTSLANTLAVAMASRRGGVAGDDEAEEEWDDDWDD